MGSKRAMLKNGLGDLIYEAAKDAGRVVDLFCGAGSVAWFAAETTPLPVLAVDLQLYAVALARAVIERGTPLDHRELCSAWLGGAEQSRDASPLWREAAAVSDENIAALVREARTLCARPSAVGPIWNAYGGHYFSPAQALTIDHMLSRLPKREPERGVCLAATIRAASNCAAAPGHTAQPFQPTTTAGPFVREAWARDPLGEARRALEELSPRHARVVGEARVGEAVEVADTLRPDDLVIVDPPYSGVQYSRFYHVLETVARGESVSVEGIGRYPAIGHRPQSDFSVRGRSKVALERLLSSLASAGATVVFTFPAGDCSNGLSGDAVVEVAGAWYEIERQLVDGSFSTLGGNNGSRASRTASSELILLMRPREEGATR
jgi:16S rRNA G966 N2-methylase RsmD